MTKPPKILDRAKASLDSPASGEDLFKPFLETFPWAGETI
jgi:hypothetical protein